jgi:hypothetical protein
MDPLTLLDFEEKWGQHTGWKEEAIRKELGMTPARFYQLQNRIIDTAEAEQARPILVHRLRRLRDQRRRHTA